MGREIKFRVYDPHPKDEAGMCHVSSIFWKEGEQWASWLHGNCKGRVSEFPLMQFTGLLDKNGVEIYEGDIAECDGEKMYVVWDAANAQFGWKFWEPVTFNEDYIETCILWEQMTVIGNIHQHPDLVEVE